MDGSHVDFGPDIVTSATEATAREWLVTNGTGSFAMGTISGIRTRGYHGLLVAALDPPTDRRVLVTSLDETIDTPSGSYPLYACRTGDGVIDPAGFRRLVRFRLDGSIPVWTYRLPDAMVEKRIWMEDGADTTFVRYDLVEGDLAILTLDVYADHRDFHAVTRPPYEPFEVTQIDGGVRLEAATGPMVTVTCPDGVGERAQRWRTDHDLAIETYRGLEDRTDDLHVGTITVPLVDDTTVAISRPPKPAVPGSLDRRHRHERAVVERAGAVPGWVRPLVLAADQFVVRRSVDGAEGASIIAGYPWFADWGRDTMIALPGLALATGRRDLAASILRTYAAHVDRGMVPNRFPDVGEIPEYNTVDATLWFVAAVDEYHRATSDDDLVRDLFPVLTSIVDHHLAGTRHGIRVDPADGLLTQGESGVQLTWMDAKVDDWVVTPRIGKPVEVNALWFHMLKALERFASVVGEDGARFRDAADAVAASFDRFWDPELGYLIDVLDGPSGDDPTLRPNQLIALRFTPSLVSDDRARSVLDRCAERLLTPMGLRTLDPDDPDYAPSYGGDRRTRDGQYHQGTVWPWLLGPYLSAHFRLHGDREAVLRMLEPLIAQVGHHGVGSISEIADGDPPHTPRGTIAQAWSVAEVLRVWREVSG